jgi:hypothetical protein
MRYRIMFKPKTLWIILPLLLGSCYLLLNPQINSDEEILKMEPYPITAHVEANTLSKMGDWWIQTYRVFAIYVEEVSNLILKLRVEIRTFLQFGL